MKKCVTVAMAGFGLRGRDYAKYQKNNPDIMKIVAISDPNENRLNDAAKEYNVSKEHCYKTAEEMLEQPRLADILFVTTQDKQHVKQAIAGIEKGYHIMMEKPISPYLDECIAIMEKAHEYNRNVTVCHVMRYTYFYQEIKKAIESGIIGDVKSIQAIENVGYFHQAHSFVRGNWRRSDETSPMILAKSCHDLDLIAWLMNKKCKRVSSFGDLSYFKKENAPEGATKRCLDGCKVQKDCPYDAEKIYVTDSITGVKNGIWKWPCSAVVHEPTVETIYEALKTGPYGRCVYHCDNNVVDHQVVIMEFEDKSTADFTMCAFTTSDGRQIKVMGTLGNIVGNIDTHTVEILPFGKEGKKIDISKLAGDLDGHEGGDMLLVESVMELHQSEDNIKNNLTSIDASIQSHVMAFAAEYSRLNEGVSVDLDKFVNEQL
ncbi:oxidoreductase [Vallitalea longa]|uniref:Oxidoreductase n=1 Tax=Vallitalea longa TaxID=2936439 RepID=A0A9W6DG16_9FIRM|nr:Gfo/Idh/MocA family oxidoreductase [Vallitalea longa]GKX29284.1 oxidoreductase [Vallitalea longa]